MVSWIGELYLTSDSNLDCCGYFIFVVYIFIARFVFYTPDVHFVKHVLIGPMISRQKMTADRKLTGVGFFTARF